MNKDKWANYMTESKIQFEKLPKTVIKDDARIPMRTNPPLIDKKWSHIKTIIDNTKLQTIPQYKSKQHYNFDTPLPLRQKFNKILSIHNMLTLFNRKKILHCNPDSDPVTQWSTYWSSWPLHRRSLLESNKLFHNILFDQKLPLMVNHLNFNSTKKLIRKALISAKTLYKEEKDIYTLNNINNYVIQRNDNLLNNQRRMINSILERKPRTIILDRLFYTDDITNSRTLTHDNKIIEEECIKHFQLLNSFRSAINNVPIFLSIQDLPIEFQDIYSPISSINSSFYDPVISPITINELKEFINKLPLHKSAGNSGIHYEDLKYLHEDVLSLILDLFNNILSTGIIPKDWNHALLYPILKPKDWGSEINNTRPIILLESTRKLFTKILTSRIHQVLSRPNIIQPNNRAGLIGESTLQPLQHLHHAIEMANIQGKTIWIGLQDLSKAYDRINVSLLKLSLKRLNFPEVIVNLLCNLFSNRHNQIILPNRLSREYNILQGIDQGEVVSPLMWIIYYDPLFAMINQETSLHYPIITNKIQNILQPDKDIPITYNTSVQSYLDDTTWIADSLDKMRMLTEKSRAFYDLANIQINVDKYKLLTNDSSKCGQLVNLAINDTAPPINITTTGRNEGERILGVYVNAFNKSSPTYKKMKKTVNHFAFLLRRKRITHNHIIYIVNKILIPILEYRSQFQIFSFKECEALMSPIKKIFKNSLHLPVSTHDNLIYNKLFPSINNFFFHQLYSQSALVNLLFNSPLLKPVALQQILQFQYDFWLPHFPSPTDLSKLSSQKLNKNFLSKLLIYFSKFNLFFFPNIDLKILGGRHPIVLEIPNLTKQDIKSLRKKRIMFMDQICSIDGSFLLPYKDVKKLANNNWKGKVPHWYKKILHQNTLSQNLRLVNPLKDPPIQHINFNTPPIVNQEEHIPRNQWIAFWDANTSTTTPVNKIPIHIPNKKKSWRYPSKPFLTLRTLAYNYFLTISNSFKNPNYFDNLIDSPRSDSISNYKDLNFNFIPNTPYFIHNIFTGNDSVIRTLINLSIEFVNRSTFSFYTDGSLHTEGPLKSRLGFGWLEVGSPPHTYTFKGSTIFQPSSTRAEIFSILTCLITVPDGSRVNIYTDSQNFISTFNNINNPCFSHRKFLKINNHHTWQAILYLVKQKSLSISLHKVKAHNDDILNNSADLLAKEGCALDPIFLNSQTSSNALMFPTFNLNGPLEKDLRKWSKNTLECCNMLSTINNNSNAYLFDKAKTHPIDWHNTSLWIKRNNDKTTCSNLNDKVTGFKIKSFNHTLPTSDLQQRNYPNLYPPGQINCTACNDLAINNYHLGFCPAHLHTLNDSLLKIKDNFTLKLIDIADVPGAMDIKAWVERCPLFSRVTNDNHPIYLVLHQCVPSTLTSLIKMFVKNNKERQILVTFIMDLFFRDITLPFWKLHSSLMHAWEKARNITRKRKINYRKKKKRTDFSATTAVNPGVQPGTSRSATQQDNNSSSRCAHGFQAKVPQKSIPRDPFKFDRKLFIYLNSSNYLHSGDWLTYLDFYFDSSFNFSFNIDFFTSSIGAYFDSHVLPEEKHDRTFGIKCCQMKSTTGLLELSVARQKIRPDFWN
ncbi:ribonuclease H-like domain-containing protein [Rhizophagus clarus]|uniref:Ribonuclease H-like domain-containing protein n=1 Tax=Rhizophagus clarus TaxID=94130 RepID=A0A8H3KSK1_9GLOM|nr:ribonuclease H-like domain-containing protein [Rhizophagus clarus]